MELAVEAHAVGKTYRLGEHTGYQLLSEVLGDRVRGIWRGRPPRETLWALADVDFEVRRGETFGIVGHNGAGKSTLLKILSRITPPTTGEIRVSGRVGSLLEVGTGFHGELTGRENIYLNGAILGMSRAEIARKFDEIVDFAEIAPFIDTPVKRYSSGMYLRLGFAVAAHLEPNVLIVDEVLAVGDLSFQEKCMGRMQRVAGEGRTVIFVSHNLAAVRKLCPRAMLLANGRKVAEGATDDVLDRYMASVQPHADSALTHAARQGSGRIRFTGVTLRSEGRPVDMPVTGRELEIALEYSGGEGVPVRNVVVGIALYTTLGTLIGQLQNDVAGAPFQTLPAEGEVVCRLPRLPLPAGRYLVNLFASVSGDVADWVQRAAEFTVAEGDFFGSGRTLSAGQQTVLIDQTWHAGAEASPELEGDGRAPEPLRADRG
jgi:lipopolysaccharide transport system ATP-binding protein